MYGYEGMFILWNKKVNSDDFCERKEGDACWVQMLVSGGWRVGSSIVAGAHLGAAPGYRSHFTTCELVQVRYCRDPCLDA